MLYNHILRTYSYPFHFALEVDIAGDSCFEGTLPIKSVTCERTKTWYVLDCPKKSSATGSQALSMGEPLGGVGSSVDSSDIGLLSQEFSTVA